MSECWGAVTELGSCTDEILLFFLNGDPTPAAGAASPSAPRTRRCWPSVLAYAGFTAQEADVLRGLCDADDDDEVAAHGGAGAPHAAAGRRAPRRQYRCYTPDRQEEQTSTTVDDGM
ncbi:LOW QUALITY PROTEIN: hypothetical protein SETIT_8G045800v2 [Setaria italica]|uniref:Uncharacterized protein n=1 Tax=Setaria italica TaxID=4555 RepID=A0A368S4C3_SETIT|nr:LOW QUALITY PROTEIN: hypothetical protein SETIT_8G045800v2 [Setaria italica]